MKMETARWQITLRMLKRGWTTALECAQAGGHLALSQRCGELGRNPYISGYRVLDKWVICSTGARVKAYRVERVKA